MQVKEVYFFLGLLLVFLLPPNTSAQNYLKKSEVSDLYFNQQLTRFPNGDLLIGDSFVVPLVNSRENGKVVMTRLDQCGNVIWAYSYSVGAGYLEFRDFLILETQEVFVYGSYFDGVRELLFLLKFDGETGKQATFRLYDPHTSNGYFAYSLREVDQGFMIYGFLVNPNMGLVAYLDHTLNPLWAKKIAPFAANGIATITQNKNILARSGNYLLRLDGVGEIDWAIRSAVNLVGGPFATPSGHILIGHQGEFSFFFKIDSEGQLIWQSDRFPAVEGSGALSLIHDGNLLFTYNHQNGDDNKLSQLMLSPSGEITSQHQLQISTTLNSGLLTQSIDDQNRITLVGNANLFVTGDADIKDFVMQFSLDQLSNACFTWQKHQSTMANTFNLAFEFVEMQTDAFDLELLETIPATTDTFTYPLSEICTTSKPWDVTSQDTVLPCGEDWMVQLPDHTFSWLDQSLENPRLLTAPGIYKAVKDDCSDPIELIYQLEREDCGCPVYLPSAFSPNGDGLNEKLTLFAECQLDQMQMQVFNRFGERIFSTDGPDQFWDGRYGKQIAEAGVYVVMIHYTWTDLNGELSQEQIYRDVTLLR